MNNCNIRTIKDLNTYKACHCSLMVGDTFEMKLQLSLQLFLVAMDHFFLSMVGSKKIESQSLLNSSIMAYSTLIFLFIFTQEKILSFSTGQIH